MKFDCDHCGAEINDEHPGGLAFGPPKPYSRSVEKYHICENCWPLMKNWIRFRPAPALSVGEAIEKLREIVKKRPGFLLP